MTPKQRDDLVQRLVDLQREIGSTANGAHCYGVWARQIDEIIAALATPPACETCRHCVTGYAIEGTGSCSGPNGSIQGWVPLHASCKFHDALRVLPLHASCKFHDALRVLPLHASCKFHDALRVRLASGAPTPPPGVA